MNRAYERVLHDFLLWWRCPVCRVSFTSQELALDHERHCTQPDGPVNGAHL